MKGTKNFLKESVVYLLGNVLAQGISFLSMLLIINKLDMYDFGVYTYVTEIALLFAFIAETSLMSYYIKSIAETRNKHKRYYSIFSFQILIICVFICLLLLTAFLFTDQDYISHIILFGTGACLLTVFTPIRAYCIATFQKEYMFYFKIVESITIISSVGAIFYFNYSNLFLFCIPFLRGFTLLIFWLFGTNKSFPKLLRFHINKARFIKIFRNGTPFLIVTLASILYNKIDIIMLEKMLNVKEVGLYGGAYKFVYPFMIISNSFMVSLFPRFVTQKNSTDKRKVLLTGVWVMAAVGGLISFSLYLGSGFLYNNILNPQYKASEGIFQILVWYLMIVFLYGPLSNFNVSEGKVNFLVVMNIVMLCVNITLNYFLIPIYHAEGAAIATLCCEVVIFVILLLQTYRKSSL